MLNEKFKQEKAEKVRQLFATLTNWEELEIVRNEKLLPWDFDTYFRFDFTDNVEKTTRYNNKFFSRPLDKAILCAELQLYFDETETSDTHSTRFCVNFSLWEKTSDEFEMFESSKIPIWIEPIIIYEDLEKGIKEYMGKYPALFNSNKLEDILKLSKEMEDETDIPF